MRKIMIFIFLLFSMSLFSVGLDGETKSSISLALDPAITSRYEMGFSGGAVNGMSDSVMNISSISLSSSYDQNNREFSGTGHVYVYWKIVSTSFVTISIKIDGPLTNGDRAISLSLSGPEGEGINSSSDTQDFVEIYQKEGSVIQVVGSKRLDIKATASLSEVAALKYSTSLTLKMEVKE